MIKEIDFDLRERLRHTLQSIHDNPHFKTTRGFKERAEMDKTLQALIFRYLYYVVSNNGKFLSFLFPATPADKFPASLEDCLDIESIVMSRNNPFYTVSETGTHISHRHTGRNCGRKFQTGEPIYRCKECSYDDTCVLCIHCFNPNDHKGHHVYTNICTHVNNGICDCGDAEAWHTTLHCKAEEADAGAGAEDMFNSDDMAVLCEVVLSEVFDHLLDVFNQNIEPLPTIQKSITVKLRELLQQRKTTEKLDFLKDLAYKNGYMQEQMAFDEDIQDELLDDLPDYVVMIYNDEYHNYSQATAALKQGIPDDKRTDKLTERIDEEGRAMLKCSDRLSTVVNGFFAVQTNGLSATLTPWSEYVHQEACKYIIMWVNHCLTIPNPAFQQVFRETMGKVLCSEHTRASEDIDVSMVVDKYFTDRFADEYAYKYADLSVLGKGNSIPISHHKRLKITELDRISSTLNGCEPVLDKHYCNSRLQHILFFDHRFWKKLRKDIQDMIIPTLASSIKFRSIFCNQLVEIFNHMSRSLAFMDREPQLTALRESVVQLFTCPTNARHILETKSFCDIMWSVIDVFAEFSKVEGGLLIWQRVQKSNPTKSYSIFFKQGLYAVETILSKTREPNLLLNPEEFIAIVTLCKLFNGAWKIRRKEGEHVIREDQYFIPYLEYTTSIYSIVQTIDKVFELSQSNLDATKIVSAIRLLVTYLGHRTLPYKIIADTYEVIKFKVSKQRVAFMNPVHTLLSFLIEKVPLETALSAFSGCRDILTIAEFPLRSVVLCSQIDVGFWVRNGMSVLRQSSYYRKNPEMGCYIRDVHLNQIAFLQERDDPVRLIYNLLDRWELVGWFNGEEEFEKTAYEDKIAYIIQQFIAFVYQLLSERLSFRKFKSSDEKEFYHMKNAVIYGLYMEPLSYSNLLKDIPEYLTENTSHFDKALDEVAYYVEPRGLEDNGVFKLKAEYYKKIDLLQLLNMENDFEHSASVIKLNIAQNEEEASKVILQPQLIPYKFLDERAVNIGDFARTDVFARLVYKLLQTSIDREEGTFLYGLLHLIHAIFRDEELINGKQSLPEAYLSKPICSLLLMIVDSKANVFSENAVSKADYLLEDMIWKNSAVIFETLDSSLGHAYVERYKARKLNQGVNFDESEKERKKRLAKLRHEKILAKFSKQQDKFMKDNASDFMNGEDIEMVDQVTRDKAEEFTCALCQDSTSSDLFVMPLYHENTPVFKSGHLHDLQQFAAPLNGFFNKDDHPTINDDETLDNYKQDGTRGSRKVFVSCNHYIHYKCFKRYAQKKRFSTNSFICPLCQTYSNCVLPVSRKSGAEDNSGLACLFSEEDTNWNIENFPSEDLADFNSIFNTFVEINNNNTNYDKACYNTQDLQRPDVIYILTTHWANTISVFEIVNRLSARPNSTLLLGKEQRFKTFRNVLASIVWIYKVLGKPSSSYPYVNSNGIVWNQNQLFQHIVKESLFSSRPLNLIVTEALSTFAVQLVSDFVKGLSSNDIEKLYAGAQELGAEVEMDEEWMTILRGLCDIGITDKSLAHKLYSVTLICLCRHLLPSLRRTLIFLTVANGLLAGSSGEASVGESKLQNVLNDDSLLESLDQAIRVVTLSGSLKEFLARAGKQSYAPSDPYLTRIPYEYCGIVKLADLTKYLNTYVTNSKEVKLRDEHPQHMKNVDNRLDFKICLACGVKIHARKDHTELFKHLSKNCFKPFGLFLVPNVSEVCLVLTSPRSTISISAPYLNSHGEAGRNAIQRGDTTILNLRRYEHLNKLWLNNEIPGYISRVLGDEFRVSIISNGVVFNFNRNVIRRPLGANTNATEESTSDDDDDEGMDFAWGELRPAEFLEDPALRMDGTAPVQNTDIREFFQFIAHLRNDAGVINAVQDDDAEEPFVPQFQFIPTFRPPATQQPSEGEGEGEGDGDNSSAESDLSDA
ncbi:LAMI_0H08504g1_1 [Lachancea mirantina]|uniref:E3 ubiquitin-protein ligase n=1 Tax=Lachancea mirantina TaxID=1230905 RepID=A0A1G4KG00_9SACH|nr:LAMI_0H08504g1_1 [Lachancea mirantina]